MNKRYINAADFWNNRPENLDPKKSEYNRGWSNYAEEIHAALEATPTADVEEVRHGNWIQTSEPKFIEGIKRIGVECSVCKIRRNIPAVENHGYYYCPECGAYMRGTYNGEE